MLRNALCQYVTVLAGTGAVLVWMTPRWLPRWPAALLALAAAAAGVWLARRRTPAIDEVARAIDRKIHAGDELVTAVSGAGDADPMAALVREAAWRRLDAFAPAQLVPFAARRFSLAVSIPLVILGVTSFTFGGSLGDRGSVLQRPGARLATGAAAPARTTTAVTPSNAGDARAAERAEASAEPVTTPSTAQADRGRAALDRNDSQRQEQMAAGPDGSAAGRSGSSLEAAHAQALGVGPLVAAGRSGRPNAPGSPAPSSLPAPAAGGVTAGPAAETAIGRAALPPGLRAYLRSYLLAIEAP